MNKEFIPYEQALELRQLGFNEHCFGKWQNLKIGKNLVVDEEDRIYDISMLGADIKAPLYQQAFRWFREKHRLFNQINIHTYFIYDISNDEFKMIRKYYKVTNTYEEAELACLRKLIEIVKNK